MNIDEIEIYRNFLNGFKNDLKRIEDTDYFYSTLPYVLRDCLDRRSALHFSFVNGILDHEEFSILSDWANDVLKKLNERLNYRLIWHGARLDEYLKNASAALIMVNCCNDLFKPIGMEFTDEKKITDN